MVNDFTTLIVDDNSDFRFLMVRRLTKLGAKVRQAKDVVEAFASLAKDGPADVVISDYRMPGASGIEFLAALREGGYNMPFVMVSGEVGLPPSEIAALGIAAFLAKPFGEEELHKVLTPLLAKIQRDSREN